MKRLIFILLLIPLFCQAQFFGLNQNQQIIPVYGGDGGITTGTSTSSINVTYPSDIDTLDILILRAATKTSAAWFSLSGQGFNSLPPKTNAGLSTNCWWKRATGNESGTIAVGNDGSSDMAGVMYLFKRHTQDLGSLTAITVNNITANTGESSALTGTQYYLGVQSFVIAADVVATDNGSGDFVEDSNINTSSAGGWRFIMASHKFISAGTTADHGYTWSSNLTNYAEFNINN